MATETMTDFLVKVKAFLRGESAPGRPEPPRPEPPRCDACFDHIVGPGYRYRGQLFCDVWCAPPFQSEVGQREIPTLAGEPGR